MKNNILRLQKIVCAAGIVLLMAGSANAELVYMTDFSVPYASTTGATTFDGTTIAPESWFGSSNGVGVGGGDLTLGNTTQNRFRGSGVWLDTTGWATGLVTVEVDVADFTAGTDSKAIFQAFAANGVDSSNSVSLDLHGSAGIGGSPTAFGSASISVLGAEQEITANGTDVPFTFNYNGTDQFIGLVFANVNDPTTGTGNTVSLDNLMVNTVPEPTSFAMLLSGIGMLTMRRRRV